jgi:hypothetical protein
VSKSDDGPDNIAEVLNLYSSMVLADLQRDMERLMKELRETNEKLRIAETALHNRLGKSAFLICSICRCV